MFKVGDKVAILSWEGNEDYAEGKVEQERFKTGTIDCMFDWSGNETYYRVAFDQTHCCSFKAEHICLIEVYESPLWKTLNERKN